MTNKQKWILGAATCATCFALGRFEAPTKTKIVTQTVTVEKKTDEVKTDAVRDTHKQTVEVSVKKPDGTVTVTTTTVEDNQAKRSSDDKSADTVDQTKTISKEITRSSSAITISILGGIPLSFTSVTPVWGASASRPFLGPFVLGAWGLSSKEAGVSVGLEF